jgi:hypothetical protein
LANNNKCQVNLPNPLEMLKKNQIGKERKIIRKEISNPKKYSYVRKKPAQKMARAPIPSSDNPFR